MSSTLTRGLILKYPLDPTGINPNNKIIGEEHDLGAGINRAIVPNYSAFYSASMVVYAEDRVEPLIPNQHFIAAQLHADATAALDREVCMAVVIIDQSIMGKVRLEYQTVGGEFSVSVDALRQAIEDEDLDDRTVSWGDIIARPSAYPPAPHLHDIGDLYGFEYVVEALEALRAAILIGDEATHEEIRQWVRYEDSLLRDRIAETNVNLNTHIQDKTNPHAVTKAQVGLGNVLNYGVAQTADMVAATSNALYTTPIRVRDAINEHAIKPLNAHIARTDNPHAVTKAQVGLGLVANYNVASQADMIAGTSPSLYTTPILVKQAIDEHALKPLNAHTARVDNPHGVTKAQVGLGNVLNYGVASEAQARAGTSDSLYMTALKTAQAISTQALVPLNAHTARVDNPHSVTKAQVGLDSVDNFATATEAEARTGTVNNRFMTPLRTAQAFDTKVLTPLNAHIARADNPHGVTKAQVGLGNVQNYSVATQALAEGAADNGTYMTPLRTGQAINNLAVVPLNAHINRSDNPHSVNKVQVGLGSIPNSITNSRGTNSDASLLTAKGMFDHVNSGDHDWRYAPKNTAGVDCSVHWNGSGVYIWGGGTWRQVWPAQWQ